MVSGDAESWLKVAYPDLHQIYQLSSLSLPSSSSSPSIPSTCSICSLRPPSGSHYGVQMCEGDKQFIKRTFHERVE